MSGDSRYHIFYDGAGTPVARINEATLGLSSPNADLELLRRFYAGQLRVRHNRPQLRERLIIEKAARSNDGSIRWIEVPSPLPISAGPATPANTSIPLGLTTPVTAVNSTTVFASTPTVTGNAIAQSTQRTTQPTQASAPDITEGERQDLVAQTNAQLEEESERVRKAFESFVTAKGGKAWQKKDKPDDEYFV